jgi:acyl-coenzyme A thioesterase PaaI-like protein
MKPNKMNRMVSKLNMLPGLLRTRALSAVLGQMVPFVGTAGLVIEEMSTERVVASVKNRRRVQNHIRTLHAAAGTLLAETASGFIVGMNLPDDKIPLMKTLTVKFKKRNKGGMRVVASLTAEQKQQMIDEPKGEVAVQVEAKDSAGVETIQCEMIWAWVPKKRK